MTVHELITLSRLWTMYAIQKRRQKNPFTTHHSVISVYKNLNSMDVDQE